MRLAAHGEIYEEAKKGFVLCLHTLPCYILAGYGWWPVRIRQTPWVCCWLEAEAACCMEHRDATQMVSLCQPLNMQDHMHVTQGCHPNGTPVSASEHAGSHACDTGLPTKWYPCIHLCKIQHAMEGCHQTPGRCNQTKQRAEAFQESSCLPLWSSRRVWPEANRLGLQLNTMSAAKLIMVAFDVHPVVPLTQRDKKKVTQFF